MKDSIALGVVTLAMACISICTVVKDKTNKIVINQAAAIFIILAMMEN